ncbi:hypothetical protein COCVIDRAFT_112997 [Bipolaris victoriae FI3]|uniref:Uncharacterized protein n=1 Tax=Bipolaris victoriae (strain FI3) TaxID=930091 RepID=W7E086_BIPV3|nr:hypothetical protein COCVIDRAFT_112997 [Bipolaris victoriae FI3]
MGQSILENSGRLILFAPFERLTQNRTHTVPQPTVRAYLTSLSTNFRIRPSAPNLP